ncbi:unnamed protein product [Mytilus coruscus]|uniref:Uncharacterized protein n=1 Tax=Mytilus coruscus TaxID=42192 RepID=A0A6J8A540_MYTCO|nr:unnamed protein product [Mytilus coruscus]
MPVDVLGLSLILLVSGPSGDGIRLIVYLVNMRNIADYVLDVLMLVRISGDGMAQVTKMTDTEKNTMHVRVKREVDRMKKMKKAKQTSQIKILKRQLFDMPGSSDALVDRLKSLNLKVGEVRIPLELRGLVESLANALSSMQEEHQKLVTRNQQLEEEKRQSEQR